MLDNLRKPYVIGSGVIAALAVAYVATLSPHTQTRELVTVTEGDIIQEVLITGTVKAAQSASLAFERSGTIQTLSLPVGGTVAKGTVLATLTSESELAAVAEAEAAVGIAEARLAELKSGTRPEELRIKEAAVAASETDLANLYAKSETTIFDAYNEMEGALTKYLDPLFSNDESEAPRLTFFANNQSLAYEAETKRIGAGAKLKELRALLTNDWSIPAENEQALSDAASRLEAGVELLRILGETLTGASLSDATLGIYRDNVIVARANMTAAFSAVRTALQNMAAAKAALEKTRREFSLARAGATSESIRTAEEEIRQVRAQLRGARGSLEKTLLRAPFRGLLSSREVEIGETVTAGKIITTVLGMGGFIIEANVPEADVTKIRLGENAEVTLDAYGSDQVFVARVTAIEPGETVVEGVPTYKTTFAFLNTDETKPRSGMTANLILRNTVKEDALLVPQKAVIEQEGKKFVRVPQNKKILLRKVTVGERGEDGMIELLAGVEAGEKILIEPNR